MVGDPDSISVSRTRLEPHDHRGANAGFALGESTKPHEDHDDQVPRPESSFSSLDVELNTSEAAWPGAVDAAQLVQLGAAKGGLNVQITRAPADGYWTDIWLVKPWCFSYWSGRPTEDWIFTSAYSADSAWNADYWKHEKFNKILLGSRRTLHQQAQRDVLRDAGNHVERGQQRYPGVLELRYGRVRKAQSPQALRYF